MKNKLISSSRLFLKRNSATILTCAGAIGVAATSIMAVKATPKALRLIEQAEEEKGDELTKLETIKVASPSYIPAIVVGASTVTCIFGANILNKRQQAALASAYALLDSSYKEYKSKLKDIYGEDANVRVKEELAKDQYKKDDILLEEDDTQLFYDDFSKRYFESTIEKVQQAEYRLNREIHMRGWATLGEFYEWIGIPGINGDEELGWSEGGNYEAYWQSWIDFNHHKVVMDDGLECTIVEMFSEPYLEWNEY